LLCMSCVCQLLNKRIYDDDDDDASNTFHVCIGNRGGHLLKRSRLGVCAVVTRRTGVRLHNLQYGTTVRRKLISVHWIDTGRVKHKVPVLLL